MMSPIEDTTKFQHDPFIVLPPTLHFLFLVTMSSKNHLPKEYLPSPDQIVAQDLHVVQCIDALGRITVFFPVFSNKDSRVMPYCPHCGFFSQSLAGFGRHTADNGCPALRDMVNDRIYEVVPRPNPKFVLYDYRCESTNVTAATVQVAAQVAAHVAALVADVVADPVAAPAAAPVPAQSLLALRRRSGGRRLTSTDQRDDNTCHPLHPGSRLSSPQAVPSPPCHHLAVQGAAWTLA